ncbi:MAG: outer membrane protein assembly factor BamD [Gemmatimonadetes bacterium]|nr:outer membrane protein assembly factor BamD [Gemmatimonadota bacterium]NNF12629.1 outer membrane protein assembly factor BamD [Gemmatimonadota bacterium]NNL30488.1 outer membrane protein assembly factor BamD [Gemmatimonadota bacterium]
MIPRALIALALFAAMGLVACGGGQSRYQGVSPDELFQMAEAEFAEGSHDNAIRALDRILREHGDWDRVAEARLMLGNVYFDRDDYLTARAEYNRFMDRYPGHPMAPDAALGACRSLAALAPIPQRDQGYTREAISACRNVVIDFAGMEQSAEAARISNRLRQTLAEKEFLNAEFYADRNMWDSAIKYYEFVVNLYPESDFVPDALLGIYRMNIAIGYDDLADAARQRLLDEYPESAAAAQVQAADGSDG